MAMPISSKLDHVSFSSIAHCAMVSMSVLTKVSASCGLTVVDEVESRRSDFS